MKVRTSRTTTVTDPRVHCEDALTAGVEITLRGERHHYLAHVLRVAPGDPLRLFNGGGEFACRVTSVKRRETRVSCERTVESLPASRLEATLYISVVKARSMDLAVQKATELGVASVRPVLAARSVVPAAGNWERKLEHWRGIARGACEQCGRGDLPEIVEPVPFERMGASSGVAAFVLDPESPTSLTAAVASLSRPRVAVLIGPEGGFADGEVEIARGKGFVPVSLGPRLLRVETAVTAALSVMQAFLGDFSDA